MARNARFFPVISSSSRALTVIKSASKSIINVGLVTAILAYELWQVLSQWYKGEISGKFAAKKALDAVTVGLVGGIGGAELGMCIGSMVAPGIGTIVGGIFGSVLGTVVVANVSGWMSCKIFNVPKTAAIDNAYRFVGVDHQAPNGDINKSYRKKAVKYHPDKNKSDKAKEEWHKLQVSMVIIRLDRGAGEWA